MYNISDGVAILLWKVRKQEVGVWASKEKTQQKTHWTQSSASSSAFVVFVTHHKKSPTQLLCSGRVGRNGLLLCVPTSSVTRLTSKQMGRREQQESVWGASVWGALGEWVTSPCGKWVNTGMTSSREGVPFNSLIKSNIISKLQVQLFIQLPKGNKCHWRLKQSLSSNYDQVIIFHSLQAFMERTWERFLLDHLWID